MIETVHRKAIVPSPIGDWLAPALLAAFAGLAALIASAVPALAASDCRLLAEAAPRLLPAGLTLAQAEAPRARLTDVGHSTFLIESPGGVRVATDYNDYVKPTVVPDIATMNRAHDTHYTHAPDPGIAHVLRGWDTETGFARHDLTLGDVLVRNVPTNIRNFDLGNSRAGNSIFVFELADLCIAHLGHLHHTLTPQDLAALGRIDVVLAPVDGTWTMDHAGMLEVLSQIGAPLVVPMHYFGRATLDRFLALAEPLYQVVWSETPTITLARDDLPAAPTILVLPGR